MPTGWKWGPGTADESFEGQQGMRQPISGSGRPRSQGSVSGGAQAGIDLAGDIALEAADDLGLGQALGGAPLDVRAGRGVGAHPGGDDPPQGVVGLAGAARGLGGGGGALPRGAGVGGGGR